jgi:hypothetical protein
MKQMFSYHIVTTGAEGEQFLQCQKETITSFSLSKKN